MDQTMSPDATDLEVSRLELGQIDLQEMLGDSLVEAQHLKELQSLEQRKLTMLQEQSLCAAAQADTLCAAASQLSAQTGQEMQRELASKCCELAEACINIHRWKKQAALQQLRLVSAQEDLGHQKVYIDALSAECSRRQELNDNLHAQLQMQHQQAAKLNSELSEASHQSGNLQTCIDSMQKTLEEKESLLASLKSKLQEVQDEALRADKASAESWTSAQQRHNAIEERARLAEQVAAAARERADIAEQRLSQRHEMAQQRDQHALDLLQERHQAAVDRAAAAEQRLKEEVIRLQAALQASQASRCRLSGADTLTQDLEGKLQQATDALASSQQQVLKRDARIAVLEEACRHRDTSATPAKLASQAMETVSTLVAHLNPEGPAAQAVAQKLSPAAHAKHAKKAPAKPQASTAATQQLTRPVADTRGAASTRQQASDADGVRSAGRGARQRSQPQPYWMSGAVAASSPATRSSPALAYAAAASGSGTKSTAVPSKQTVAAADAAASPSTSRQAAKLGKQPARANAAVASPVPEGVQTGPGKKAGRGKRQAKGSPQKEEHPQHAVKKPKAAAAEQQGTVADQADVSTAVDSAAETTVVPFAKAKPGPAAAPSDAIAGALQRFGLKHPTRPVGVSKIDLASSFTQASSSPTMPSATQSAATSQPPNAATGVGRKAAAVKPGQDKENETAQGLLSKGPQAGGKALLQPPKALNERVVAAAADRRAQAASEASAGTSKPSMQAAAPNKRRILKPVNVNYNATGKYQDMLPANMLFGDAFKVPKLRK